MDKGFFNLTLVNQEYTRHLKAITDLFKRPIVALEISLYSSDHHRQSKKLSKAAFGQTKLLVNLTIRVSNIVVATKIILIKVILSGIVIGHVYEYQLNPL